MLMDDGGQDDIVKDSVSPSFLTATTSIKTYIKLMTV